jgi:PAS domain-containing protein
MNTQQEIEIILARQLASYLGVPVFIVDPEGTLLFYNEPAESILGRRFEESGRTPLEEWSTGFRPREEDGTPIPPEELPLVVSLTERRPAHRGFYIRGLDDVPRYIEVTSFPLVGPGSRLLGALAVFWEAE